MDFTGKTAVVTGASRGLGAAIARVAAERGMNVAACARTLPSLSGERVFCAKADVSNEADVEAFSAATVDRFGSIDLWFNNAGILEPIDALRNCESADVERHLKVNVLGVFHGSKVFANHLRGREGQGVLINISSGASTSAYAGWGAYCAGKAAVDRMTEVLQLEEEAHGMRAYAIAPGIIDTDMQSLIRSCSADRFPMVDKFIELKAQDAFSSAEYVANRLLEVAFDPAKRPDSVCFRLPLEND